MTTIKKLYLSNFLAGLVFYYGIEKLFMRAIGIDAVGISICIAILLLFNLVFDIPAGVLADKWSRKNVLALSAISMALSVLILGYSHGLASYIIGYVFYGIFVVFTSGIYQALIYDVLHERGRAGEYSKIMGRAYGLYLVGAGVGNVASGIIAHYLGLRWPYFLTLIPAVLNFFILLSVHEPTFHKAEHKEKILTQLSQVSRTIIGVGVMRSLLVAWIAFNAVEVFKGEFSQLYMLKFTSSSIVLGLLWAGYSFAWALGSFIAHRFKDRLGFVLMVSCATLILLGLTTTSWGLLVFMLQATAGGMAFNLIEMRVQDMTPSRVRASVISVMYTLARLIGVPAGFFFGWVIRAYDVFWAIRACAAIALIVLVYWLLIGQRRLNTFVTSEKKVVLPHAQAKPGEALV